MSWMVVNMLNGTLRLIPVGQLLNMKLFSITIYLSLIIMVDSLLSVKMLLSIVLILLVTSHSLDNQYMCL